jgi:hypothetical protein
MPYEGISFCNQIASGSDSLSFFYLHRYALAVASAIQPTQATVAHRLEWTEPAFEGFCVSPSGSRFAFFSGEDVSVYEPQPGGGFVLLDGKKLHARARISALCFLSDSPLLLAAASMCGVQLLAKGLPPRLLPLEPWYHATALCYDARTDRLAVGGWDGAVVLVPQPSECGAVLAVKPQRIDLPTRMSQARTECDLYVARVTALAFSRAGDALAVGTQKRHRETNVLLECCS